MKISITITQKEKEDINNKIWVDPCAYFKCGEIDCEICPLREAAENLREAQHKFINIVNSITIQN
jgi:hypothetical protein